MTRKTLNLFAETIKTSVPYRDGKVACANLISDIAKKKLGDKWTAKREAKFFQDCGV